MERNSLPAVYFLFRPEQGLAIILWYDKTDLETGHIVQEVDTKLEWPSYLLRITPPRWFALDKDWNVLGLFVFRE